MMEKHLRSLWPFAPRFTFLQFRSSTSAEAMYHRKAWHPEGDKHDASRNSLQEVVFPSRLGLQKVNKKWPYNLIRVQRFPCLYPLNKNLKATRLVRANTRVRVWSYIGYTDQILTAFFQYSRWGNKQHRFYGQLLQSSGLTNTLMPLSTVELNEWVLLIYLLWKLSQCTIDFFYANFRGAQGLTIILWLDHVQEAPTLSTFKKR